MQTISTKYLPATTHLPSRVVATSSGGCRLVMSVEARNWEGAEETHVLAAQELKRKLNWKGRMIGGDTKSGKVFVFDSGEVIE